MKRFFSTEFIFQLFALMVSVIIVHGLYVGMVRPYAERDLAEQTINIQEDTEYVANRSLWIVIQDYEQESCFILMLWALAIMGYKSSNAIADRRMIDLEILSDDVGTKIKPEDAKKIALDLKRLPLNYKRRFLARLYMAALDRFAFTTNIQDVSAITNKMCETENERMDSELSMIRYIAWAIPSVGFIGTVRGIGEALGQAHRAVDGDISGVTQSLGTAFNSTFVALLISILIMFFLHQLQSIQERLVFEYSQKTDEDLINRMQYLD
jgi:biopolymer transport protein ExbB/TolQ